MLNRPVILIGCSTSCPLPTWFAHCVLNLPLLGEGAERGLNREEMATRERPGWQPGWSQRGVGEGGTTFLGPGQSLLRITEMTPGPASWWLTSREELCCPVASTRHTGQWSEGRRVGRSVGPRVRGFSGLFDSKPSLLSEAPDTHYAPLWGGG